MAAKNCRRGCAVSGKRHAEGGVKAVVTDDNNRPVEVEGGEAIMCRAATQKFWRELSRMNQSVGGDPITKPIEQKAQKGGFVTHHGKKTKIISVPFSKIISYNYKLKETAEEIKEGKLSRKKEEPATLSYVPELKKYLLQDGNHRALELKADGKKKLLAIINPFIPKTYQNNLHSQEFSTIKEFKYERGGVISGHCPTGMHIQTILFSKDVYGKAKAVSWLRKHKYKTTADEGLTVWRFRQVEPKELDKKSFRTKRIAKGINIVIGCLKKQK